MSGKKDFVMQPLHKRLNRGNIVSRIEEVENRTDARPSERVEAVGQIAPDTGEMKITRLYIVNNATGLADVTIDEFGIKFLNQEGDLTFEDTDGDNTTIVIYSDGVNDLVLKNAYGGKGVRFDVDDVSHNVRQHAITYDGINIDAGAKYFVDGQAPAGTYTPTLTNTTNIDASAVVAPFTYMVSGDGKFVTAAGNITIDPTAAANTVLGISIPIASNFAGVADGSGTGATQLTNTVGTIATDATNDRMTLTFQATATVNAGWRVMFMYQIL